LSFLRRSSSKVCKRCCCGSAWLTLTYMYLGQFARSCCPWRRCRHPSAYMAHAWCYTSLLCTTSNQAPSRRPGNSVHIMRIVPGSHIHTTSIVSFQKSSQCYTLLPTRLYMSAYRKMFCNLRYQRSRLNVLLGYTEWI